MELKSWLPLIVIFLLVLGYLIVSETTKPQFKLEEMKKPTTEEIMKEAAELVATSGKLPYKCPIKALSIDIFGPRENPKKVYLKFTCGDKKFQAEIDWQKREVVNIVEIVPQPSSINELKLNAEKYVGKTVTVEGIYYGWIRPTGFRDKPLTRSDWIIGDGTGYIYITGMGAPKADPFTDAGKLCYKVRGTVLVKGGTVYIDAVDINPGMCVGNIRKGLLRKGKFVGYCYGKAAAKAGLKDPLPTGKWYHREKFWVFKDETGAIWVYSMEIIPCSEFGTKVSIDYGKVKLGDNGVPFIEAVKVTPAGEIPW